MKRTNRSTRTPDTTVRRPKRRSNNDPTPRGSTTKPARRRRVPVTPPRKPLWRRWLWPLTKWSLVAAIWVVIAVGGLIAWYARDLPSVETALEPSRRPSVSVLAADGSLIGTVGDYFGRAVRVDELPPALPQAVMAVEDRRFYDHFGVDPIGILRAAVANVQAGAVIQGGSTITQQAAKNLFLSPERTFKRKAQELLLALWLEHKFTKDQILSVYLNRAYFGAGAYGVDAASQKFFDRPVTRITTYQAAMLAGLLKAPSRYNPLSSPVLADQRARFALARMVDAGFLTEEEADAAVRLGRTAGQARQRIVVGRYFIDWISSRLADIRSAADRNRDLTIRTTLDRRLQRIAESHVSRFLNERGSTLRVEQGALVATDLNGAVRAMVGGRDYRKSAFNRVTQAVRQPGSAFKPIVYAAGLESGLTPDSRMVDAPLQLANWSPGNFSGQYQGEMSLRDAFAGSVNTIAVRVGQHAEISRVIDVARRLGISADLTPTPSLALGSSGVTLLELTGAYTAFANGGIGVWAYGIESIYDSDGVVLFTRSGSGAGRVLSPRHAAEISGMLAYAVRSGTGRAARLERPVAGKTGTSQNFRDAWFVGFTADLVAGVWVGNDDDQPMKQVTGSGLPARIWQAFMTDAEAGGPSRQLVALTNYTPQPPAQSQAQRPVTSPQKQPADPDLWDRIRSFFGN